MSNQTLLIVAVAGVAGYFLFVKKAPLPTYVPPRTNNTAGLTQGTNMPRDPSAVENWLPGLITGLADAGAKIYNTYEANND